MNNSLPGNGMSKREAMHVRHCERRFEQVETPAYVYDKGRIAQALRRLDKARADGSCHVLFSLKSFSVVDGLQSISPHVDGFAASSLNEVKLARDVLENKKLVHFTTPGLRPEEIESISHLCDYISFNSLSQLERLRPHADGKCKVGIRINPELSFVRNERYNPCRKYSKLGVPLSKIIEVLENGSGLTRDVDGLLVHTNCESEDFGQLLETVKLLNAKIPKLLDKVSWINLGGGYLFDESTDWDPFLETVALLKDRYGLKVFFEPGRGIVAEAGYIVSTVLDIFESDGKKIAILDTTVNHMPEVFEFQYRPSVLQESENGKYRYILAGATCLAGDLFGEYSFDLPLEIGSRIVFMEMGAYTMVKAHMFNGLNLPSIYAFTAEGKLELKRRYGYEDYKSLCGGRNGVLVSKGNRRKAHRQSQGATKIRF